MKSLTKKQKEVILTQKGEVSKSIINALRNCAFKGNKVYHYYTSGSGRFITNHSAYSTVVAILKASNYKFTEGNDAPRGGKAGEFIKLSKTAMDFLLSIK